MAIEKKTTHKIGDIRTNPDSERPPPPPRQSIENKIFIGKWLVDSTISMQNYQPHYNAHPFPIQ